MRTRLALILTLAVFGLAACEALGDARDRRVDPGAPYRPMPYEAPQR
jgi:hypothetical protein